MRRLYFAFINQKIIFKLMVMAFLLFLAVEFGFYGINLICVGNANPLQGKKIVIDPGHGGIDGGTNCPGFLEKEVNLAVAKKLREKLTKLGAKVILTREQDVELDQLNSISSSRHKRDLQARISIIEKSQPDIFLSIHVNANHRKPSTSGSMIFYNRRLLKTAELSKNLQRHLNNVSKNHNLKEHNPDTADFYILRNSNYIGAIIELGFMTNHREKRLLKQDQYQWELTNAITEGVKEYFLGRNQKTDITYRQTFNNNRNPKGVNVNLYFPSKITDCLESVSLKEKMCFNAGRNTEELIRETVTALLNGPHSKNLMTVLDPKVQIHKLVINNGIVEIDFSKELKNIPDEDFAQFMAVTSLVETITQFPGIRGVKLLIEGKPIDIPLGDIELSKVLTPKKPKAIVSLVIDDLAGGELGRNEIMSIKRPLTLAVLPGRKLSSKIAEEAFQKGYQVFLHLPMEPDRGKPDWLGNGAITTGMSTPEIRKTFLADLCDVPHAVGFNNHMGSKVTKRENIIQEVLSIAKEKKLIVLDSRTTEDSVIPKVAKKLNIPALERNVFLDVKSSKGYVKDQIRKLAEIACRKGNAIGIGHVGVIGKNTAQGISEMIPVLEDQGIELVFVSDLLE